MTSFSNLVDTSLARAVGETETLAEGQKWNRCPEAAAASAQVIGKLDYWKQVLLQL
jgi:hypothetical protein